MKVKKFFSIILGGMMMTQLMGCPAPNTAQPSDLKPATVKGNVTVPDGTQIASKLLLPSGILMPSGILLPSAATGFNTLQAEEGEKVFIGKEFIVKALDDNDKVIAQTKADENGKFELPEVPVDQNVRIKAGPEGNENIELTSAIKIPANQSGQKVSKNVNSKSTAFAEIFTVAKSIAEPLGLGGLLDLNELEKSPIVRSLIDQVTKEIINLFTSATGLDSKVSENNKVNSLIQDGLKGLVGDLLGKLNPFASKSIKAPDTDNQLHQSVQN